MDKYIRKRNLVEAIQLKKSNILEVYKAINNENPDLSSRIASDRWDEYEDIVKERGIKIKTPESGEGTQIASIGDYIVFGDSKDLGRHCWPVKPDFFEENYELYIKNKKSEDRLRAEALWKLLDDIDTLSDIIKPIKEDGYKAFYKAVMSIASKRFDVLKSDGYDLFTPKEFKKVNKTNNNETKHILN